MLRFIRTQIETIPETICSINQQIFNHILNSVYSSGVLRKGDVGLEKVQGVTMITGKEWLLDESDGLGQHFLV